MATPSFFNDHCPCVRMALPSAWMSKTLAADSQCLFCLNGFAIATKGYAYFCKWLCPSKRYHFQGFTCHSMKAIPLLENSFASQKQRIPPMQKRLSLFFIFINFSVKFNTYSLIPMIRMKLGKVQNSFSTWSSTLKFILLRGKLVKLISLQALM